MTHAVRAPGMRPAAALARAVSSAGRPAAGGAGGPSGFTLLELLVAMALLATLGTFLVQLVKNSFDLYHEGDRRSDLYANAVQILQMMEEDLLAVHSGPDGRFVLETAALGGGRGQGDGFLLRLVRGLPHGERSHPVLRQAGTRAGAQGNYDGSDPGRDARPDLAPPSGLVEVAWALIADPADAEGRPGILTLYRGVHAPVLAPGGFFDSSGESERDEGWVRKNLRPVATDILGLWIFCFGQETEAWGEDEVLETYNPEGQSTTTWDSTRGLLPKSAFPLALGPQSAGDERDDVYPKLVRILLHVARGGRPDALLRSSLTPDETVLRLTSTRDLPPEDEPDRYVKVGREWLLLGATDSTDVRVARRKRHTAAVQAMWPSGTPVYAGRVFRKTLALPARRSWWEGGGR